MITFADNVFRLETADTGYTFRITKHGHLEHIYYGAKLPSPDIEALAHKRTAQAGSTVAYGKEDPLYCLDTMCLEWSGIGKGDYRLSPAEFKMPDGGFVTDFVYESHSVKDGYIPMKELPSACAVDGECASLIINLRDKSCAVTLTLIYTVFEKANCITRRVILENRDNRPLVIRRLLSMSFDTVNSGFTLITFDGDWAKEAHRHDRPLQHGVFVNESRTGASGNKHNPGFLLCAGNCVAKCENNAGENHGMVYGFNLIYSGNHFGFVELSSHELVRVGLGISPHCFEWTLAEGEGFETPEAVITFSDKGFNGLSRNFHSFVNNYIIPEAWQHKERPVLYNSWEPCFFKFNQGKLLGLARQAKKLGVELFVLDDGWFEGRDNDSAGLGDYAPNRRKFPRGLAPFAKKIRKLGLDFGIWVEPEMVNENSNLYRAHPEWAVQQPGRESTLGRNQLVLDLCNPAVRDYIVVSVGKLLDETGASYVKWDMNRHISEFWSEHIASQGEFFHRYILGLYDVLRRIFQPRPRILLETCSSGGNRFDLGMLCFSPQIWASDNTDPVERLQIQGGLSYLYPQSTMGAHVSDAPHQQTLRDTPLSTRYNAACFGCLGYEMDLRYLSPVEKCEVKEQIAFYKARRKVFQYGTFERLDSTKANKTVWLCRGDDQAVAGFFQTLADVSEGHDALRISGFDPETRCRISTKPQKLYIKRFGGLVKHITPVPLNPAGFILRTVNRHYALTDCVETYECSGSALAAGILLNNQFMGSHYNNKTRLLGDYGSNLYVIEMTEMYA
ncbi:MAG: alpha-galactosidase [Treponema sp.]|jgi:alpha-galactosidase|nr:alpha-galactosidase [Treponema sp.]